MPLRHSILAAALAAFAWTAVGATAQDQEPPPAGAQPGAGRGAGPAGRQGGGGGRGPNFPQQQRPLAPAAVLARGQALYGVSCTACHGVDLRGGDQGGPNLLRSQVVLTDERGEGIGAVIRRGRQGPVGMMPAFSQLAEDDVIAIAEYIHSVMAKGGRQGRPPEGETPVELNILVGNASAGAAYFARACSRCHSSTGDLRGIAARMADPRDLQNLWVSGGNSGRGGGARGGGGGGGIDPEKVVRVTVTAPGRPPVTGRLVRIDDFIVTLVHDDGTRVTFRREGASPRVEVTDPMEAHRRLVRELTDADMHDITAYLATLK